VPWQQLQDAWCCDTRRLDAICYDTLRPEAICLNTHCLDDICLDTLHLEDTNCVQKANTLILLVWETYALALFVWTPFFLFVFVLSYSYVAYLDYGGVLFDHFPAAVGHVMVARCKLTVTPPAFVWKKG
jgi:hypothetical protein